MNITTRSLVAWSAYPVVMLSCIIAHYWLLATGTGLQAATYVPVISGALIITLLELKFSCRKEWAGNKNDFANDATYMVLVQILLPRLLSFAIAITLLDYFQVHQLTFKGWWPQTWPVWAQAILMLTTADFLRYWLHVASHNWIPLWRLHAVHHSPHKLYWVNVGRFHPVEKTLQFVFDTLPFIILGIKEEVLALYFVFYAVNGFFQHSNVNVKLGPLNYIVSGPELHRWHHSMVTEESNRNYGNNLIIWDILFGTRFLPNDRQVGELGLKNRHYPMTFLAQLKTPFIKGIDQG